MTTLLFFAKSPQEFFPEAYITCVRYQSLDRFAIVDKKYMMGILIQQIEDAMNFTIRHTLMRIAIGQTNFTQLTTRQEIYKYPIAALREAIINAVTYRDYVYDAAHIYFIEQDR